MLEDRLFKNSKSMHDYEQLNTKTKHLKPVENDKYKILDEIDIPDSKKDIP